MGTPEPRDRRRRDALLRSLGAATTDCPLGTWVEVDGDVAFLIATSAGSFTLLLQISGEVVPYTGFWPAYGTYTVHPS